MISQYLRGYEQTPLGRNIFVWSTPGCSFLSNLVCAKLICDPKSFGEIDLESCFTGKTARSHKSRVQHKNAIEIHVHFKHYLDLYSDSLVRCLGLVRWPLMSHQRVRVEAFLSRLHRRRFQRVLSQLGTLVPDGRTPYPKQSMGRIFGVLFFFSISPKNGHKNKNRYDFTRTFSSFSPLWSSPQRRRSWENPVTA